MKSSYLAPISIHPEFLKKVKMIADNCGEEAANIFIEAVKNLKEKLILLKSEAELENIIKELKLTNTIVFPTEYKDNHCCRSDNLFFEMPICRAEKYYYYGRIMLCFPYLFLKNNVMDELEKFCEMTTEKVKKINNVEIYEATYFDDLPKTD